jgi:glycerate-2-kinase
MFERRLYHHIDWALVIAILALCALGVLMINSTTADPTRAMSRMYITQMYAIVLGLGAMVFMLTLDYRAFTEELAAAVTTLAAKYDSSTAKSRRFRVVVGSHPAVTKSEADAAAEIAAHRRTRQSKPRRNNARRL